GVPTASITSANRRISSSRSSVIRWRRSARIRAMMSRSGPAPNSDVSRRRGTVAVPVSSSLDPSRLTMSTVASASSSRDTALAMERLVTFSACTRRVTWSCHALTSRAAWVARSGDDLPRAAIRSRGSVSSLGIVPSSAESHPKIRPASAANSDCQAAVVPPEATWSSRAVPAGWSRQRARQSSAARSLAEVISDSIAVRAADVSGCARAGGGAAVPARLAPPPRLHAAQEVARAGEVLPAREHLAAHEGAVLHGPVDLVQARLVRTGDRTGQAGPQGDLVLHPGGEGRHPDTEGVENPGHGAGEHGHAAVGLFRGLREP